jgi:hypothetical protein
MPLRTYDMADARKIQLHCDGLLWQRNGLRVLECIQFGTLHRETSGQFLSIFVEEISSR